MDVMSVENIWKKFKIPHERPATVVDHILGALSLWEGERYKFEEFWALKGINLQLHHKESLGIIGPNGSGKSTLLNIAASIMQPDKGRIVTEGTVAMVLELGIGFHDDLTVKENALVYGVIMGLPRSEMKKRTDSILDFAGLTRFQDAKLRYLSSGMRVRLAFSIAIQTSADIFLLDEALSVGDVEFQEKCLAKFRELKSDGSSIVLVSHNLGLIEGFCEKTLYLLNGEPRGLGPSGQVISQYLQDMKSPAKPTLTKISGH